MMDTLFAAIFSGVFAGAVSWGVLRAEVRILKNSVAALHVRVDVLMMALAQHGLIDPAAVGHLSREQL
jgi:hypothetical protein